MRKVVRRTHKFASTKDLILNTALRIASVEGLAGLTIGKLAKAVGMSKSGLFAHFEAKDNLQLMVLKMASIRFIGKVLKPAFSEPRGEPRIRAIFENWKEYIEDRSDLPGGSVFIAASFELDDQPGPLRDFVLEAQKNLVDNLKKAARISVEEGHFRKDLDLGQFAWQLYAFFLGYHHFNRLLQDPKAQQYLEKAFEDLLKSARKGDTQQKTQRAAN